MRIIDHHKDDGDSPNVKGDMRKQRENPQLASVLWRNWVPAVDAKARAHLRTVLSIRAAWLQAP